jgi:acetyl-CoA synthetase
MAGDAARKDEDGYIWIIGRTDDMIKISGHLLGSAEIESGFVSHPAVAEAAVIDVPDDLRGSVAQAYCILRQGVEPNAQLEQALKEHIRREIGPLVVFSRIEFVTSLPKTRSGKIMRRVLRARAQGLPEGDTSTLEE